MTVDFAALLREARAHVAATRDRTNTRTTYEAALELLERIDRALGAKPDEEERIIWP